MSFILEDAFEETKKQYQLKLLAGKKGLAKPVSWVYQLEETTIISHFWGEELAVTMGLGFQTKEALIALIDKLIAYNASGLFINVGPYLSKIDEEVIDYCEKHDFPLVTIPWEIILADFIKDYCIRVFRQENDERELIKAFITAIETPGMQEVYQPVLNRNFNLQGSFQVAILTPLKSDTMEAMQRRRLLFQLKKAFEELANQYIVFWYEESFALIVNDLEEKILIKLLERMEALTKISDIHNKVHMGYGTPVHGITELCHAYKRAQAALHMAELRDEQLCSFRDMGVYQLLFSVEDKDILCEMYEETLAPLKKYDEEHHTTYEEVLYEYLKYNGSIQAIAEATYTHRNTVLYRIKKVKEILGQELESTQERFPYQVAFYIRDML